MNEKRQNLHRNNAAEWVMYAACLPFAAIYRLFHRA
jgi:hypothetical protein